MHADCPERPRILLVDDDVRLLRVLTLRLESEGYSVAVAENGEQARLRLEETEPDFVIADLRMPDVDGIMLLQNVQAIRPGLPVAILTAHGDIPDAVRATQAGAVDFLTKPARSDLLLECIRRHLCIHGDRPDGRPATRWAPEILTQSPAVRAVLENARRVARLDPAVLISGPSGSGKELLARAIHGGSPRRERPFVAINCAAVPPDLLESELFGHKRGAFTGAHADQPGLFRAADGGSVLLDEIGDMPPLLQVKLLRVLQEREVRPVGEVRSIPVDVRVISATHRDLEHLVRQGRFREDLYYRLNVVELRLPPLSVRREDIPLLVAARLRELGDRGGAKKVYSPEAMELLLAARWPGNVRQLFNVVERTVALSPGRVIAVELVRKALGEPDTAISPLDQARDVFIKDYLIQTLRIAEGNVSRAARLAGRNRTDFYKLMRRYGVPSGHRTADE
ncbi:MAG: sigma-54 dependent transcriptional regulator [Pseudomonadota bacterium]|nr:sigma-54 dependent transcriptional regulator [Pseudomonadota bacterium]